VTTAVSAPVVARTRADLTAVLADKRAAGPVVLVPTMGALHEGHASLIRLARDRAGEDGAVVVSIFVNPLQFGVGEDLDRYPRTFDADLEMCGAEGVDLVFVPGVDEVYPGGEPQITVEPGPLATILEGKTRPGHFRGVLTVVAKLFGLVGPDVAVFGEKDYQQFALISRMAADLCFPVEIMGGPTHREDDGLARSSRNRFLDPVQREQAVTLSRVLLRAAEAAHDGYDAALALGRAELRASEGVDLDYFEIRATDLGELRSDVRPGTPARALIAARVGTTRLIDNLALTIGGPTTEPTEKGSS
jgi:pantoate--beta-alanine ligase